LTGWRKNSNSAKRKNWNLMTVRSLKNYSMRNLSLKMIGSKNWMMKIDSNLNSRNLETS
jgi:hypothetical protein